MRVVLFFQHAHSLRGIVSNLIERGHDVRVFDPSEALDVDEATDGADLVLVHESSGHDLAARIGRTRARGGQFTLLFHDRAVTDPAATAAHDLQYYDGVLASGEVIRERYVALGWSRQAWTWHEAVDTRVFRPFPAPREGDLVWIGNWDDGERSEELRAFLIDPVRALGLRARVHGAGYLAEARAALAEAGIEYAGWLANDEAPFAYARHAVTVHVPRRLDVEMLPGIPDIRVFEALACGIPLVSCWWDDCEALFRPGRDFVMITTARGMRHALRDVLGDPALASARAKRPRDDPRAPHVRACVDQLLAIVGHLCGTVVPLA